MGLFTPKCPSGAAPERKPSRRERREAEMAAAQERHTTVGEADLRRWESQGWRVDRRSRFVVVDRETSGDGYEMRSFTVLGNGRYGKR